jgi:hypothetical protein
VLGMPYDVFWYGKPDLFFSYIEAAFRKVQREEKTKAYAVDYQAWLNGLYCYEGFSVVLANAFKKGARAKYSKEPMSITNYKKEKASATAERDKRLRAQYLGFKTYAEAMNRRR